MKTKTDISKLSEGGDYLIFCDDEDYSATIKDAQFRRCAFSNLGLKAVSFQGGRIKNCRFERVYMRNAAFHRVDLSGTQFWDCNLRHTSFEGSKLWYVEFHRCDLDYDHLIQNRPREYNLERRLLRNLRVNALQRGDNAIVRRLLLLELEAERKEKYAIWAKETPYFEQNFNDAQRHKALRAWVAHHIQLRLWGYGMGLGALLRSAAFVILFFALLFVLTGSQFVIAAGNERRTVEVLESIYASAITFATLGFGDYAPVGFLARSLVVIESLSGATFVGLLAAVAYRRINR